MVFHHPRPRKIKKWSHKGSLPDEGPASKIRVPPPLGLSPSYYNFPSRGPNDLQRLIDAFRNIPVETRGTGKRGGG